MKETYYKSDKYIKVLLDATHDEVFIIDKKGIVIDTNQTHVYNKSREEIIGNNMFELMPEDLAGKRKSILNQVINTGKPVIFQDQTEEKYFDSNVYPVFNNHGEIIQLAIFTRDITDLKTIEKKIQNLLSDKEILFKEFHHRIKNNMNTLKSMFSLQINATENPEIKGVLHMAMNRIALMSKIYEQLYQTPDMQEINIHSVINDLIIEIQETFESSQNCNISLEIDIPNILVKAKQSFYLGIIINELVTNAYKYAFSNRTNGVISISIKETDMNTLQIKVQDDGVGISDKYINKKSYGFGLQLVNIFTNQYKGKFKIINHKGTIVTVTLTKED